MKSFALLTALPALVSAASYSKADYDSGRVHNMVMQSKEVRCAADVLASGFLSCATADGCSLPGIP